MSLVPSATETLLALGADVVGCTRFCNQPGIPTVGGTKNPDVGSIGALAPDVVVMDTEENLREHAEALRTLGIEVAVTEVRSVEDALAVVDQLAAAAGVERPDDTRAGTGPAEPICARAFVPIWRRPWMTINGRTYGASLLRTIGVDLVTGDHADPYPTVDLARMADERPELVLVPSEPYSFTPAHVRELQRRFPTSRVVEVDGEDLFWWGVRTPSAGRRLHEALAKIDLAGSI